MVLTRFSSCLGAGAGAFSWRICNVTELLIPRFFAGSSHYPYPYTLPPPQLSLAYSTPSTLPLPYIPYSHTASKARPGTLPAAAPTKTFHLQPRMTSTQPSFPSEFSISILQLQFTVPQSSKSLDHRHHHERQTPPRPSLPLPLPRKPPFPIPRTR